MFRTRSQAAPARNNVLRPIIVHDFALKNSPLVSPEETLRLGRLTIENDAVWRTLDASRSVLRDLPLVSFELNAAPPKVRRERPLMPPDWDTVPSDEEIFFTDDLEAFQTTDLDCLFMLPKRTATMAGVEGEESVSKRAKLIEGSLRDLITPPHILSSPPDAPAQKYRGPVYAKEVPIPIPPNAHPLPTPSPYARRIWAIPLRGRLPWRYATTASILVDSAELPKPPDPGTNEILWSGRAIKAFWAFLLDIRANRVLGPIGLSFNVSLVPTVNSQFGGSYMGFGQAQAISEEPAVPSTASSVAFEYMIPLHQIDHIKVYHDAMNSMELRNVLYAWSYVAESGTKMRLLKGARFVLLDERSQGILVL
ncbi:hypothetical protein MIND_01176100 [Mycena indigotica]|uniref:Uncharacterized protein n=1 Tax=Mycena indigotica TaxID=2126181 RepID=A0A8H6S4J4_9AGAR|nr:uncharacterized protein MIND_01176100 [Mycena indigotica]KAF7292774.1 hypothetical protein MIND_01176100 [Mycena indigotica]